LVLTLLDGRSVGFGPPWPFVSFPVYPGPCLSGDHTSGPLRPTLLFPEAGAAVWAHVTALSWSPFLRSFILVAPPLSPSSSFFPHFSFFRPSVQDACGLGLIASFLEAPSSLRVLLTLLLSLLLLGFLVAASFLSFAWAKAASTAGVMSCHC